MKIPMNAQEMKDRLNAVCVEGIEIVRIVRLPENAGNAMASVAAASYTAAMKQDESVLKAGVSLSDFSCLESVIPAFLDQEQIFITKETKKGVSQMDIRPGIFLFPFMTGFWNFRWMPAVRETSSLMRCLTRCFPLRERIRRPSGPCSLPGWKPGHARKRMAG